MAALPDPAGPPEALVRGLVDGPSLVRSVDWSAEATSTNELAVQAALDGAPEGHLVLADRQTAGRGRLRRPWIAPPGTSLLLSLVLRPVVLVEQRPLLPLLTGLALAEALAPSVPGAQVALKWPNDVLVDGRKVAGILVESAGAEAVVVGVGVNVDWRAVSLPPEVQGELAGATSLADVAGRPLDRWRVLAAVVGVLGNRYRGWQEQPTAFLAGYRQRCATLDQHVRVTTVGDAPAVEGTAVAVAADGRLVVRTDAGEVAVAGGDVHHVRPVA
jgi:BirA family transcriptional regulator, biotin operon repressor / biotin---[acetyl-CoA-carboxylase] ligase